MSLDELTQALFIVKMSAGNIALVATWAIFFPSVFLTCDAKIILMLYRTLIDPKLCIIAPLILQNTFIILKVSINHKGHMASGKL